MSVTAISLFRFRGLAGKGWAFSQMAWARRPLAALPDLEFFKLFGTGGKESFHPYPNFSVYAILTVWPDLETAKARIREAAIFERYRQHSVESWNVYLEPTRSRGSWDNKTPFTIGEPVERPGPIAVLTRATIRTRHLWRFWRFAPSISDMTTREPEMIFKQGMGEIPWIHQVTFSIWTSLEAMTDFAYRSGYHARAVKAKREEDWFKEELFARFVVLDHHGRWQGRDPLADIAATGEQSIAA